MGKLPFVVAPKLESRVETLGSDASGKIEIERKGYLTVGEKAFMANVNSQDVVLQLMLKLSGTVSKKYKLSQQEAYDTVVAAITQPANCAHPVTDDFAEEVASLANAMMAQEQKRVLMMAYCLLVYRVDESLTIDDITDMHEDLVTALVDLYNDEEAKSVDRLLSEDEDPKKPDSEAVDAVEKK